MDIRSFFLGRGDFKSADEIVDLVRSRRGQADFVGTSWNAEPLLIFQTSKQQTWLVAVPDELYCLLDDVNKGFTRIQWVIPSERLIEGQRVTAAISTRDKTERTGLLDINERRNWLFSKKLFTESGIETNVRDAISKTMIRS